MNFSQGPYGRIMNESVNQGGLQLPERIRGKLEQFQRRIWLIKITEGLCAAAFGLLVSYLVVFGLDRFFDTSAAMRAGILLTGSIGLAIWFPLVCHKWIWKSRRLEQVARMLKVRHPRLGDYLLGIIELVHSDGNDGRSEALCRAALQQADRETADRDFTKDVPHPRHRRWIFVVAFPLVAAALALLIVPAAGSNALQRWLMPWRNIDRYTFTNVEALPKQIVVPIAEQSAFEARLTATSQWNPASGSVWIGSHRVDAAQQDGLFEFQLPPIQSPTDVQIQIGDVRESVSIDPQPRPELTSLEAMIQLPAYLQRTEPVRREIRGGSLSVVNGSSVAVQATASRMLASATADGLPLAVDGPTIATQPTSITESRVLELAWRDAIGLSAKAPLKLKIRSSDDEAPSLSCRELEQQRVIMEKDVLAFEVDALDDFGIKTLGMEWSGTPATTSGDEPAKGEKIVYAGNPNATELSAVAATFSPKRESIAPQTIQLRLFAEDYLPDRERVYSPVYTVYVLSEDEHAIWLTRRLDEWFKQSLETYEMEQQLYKKNVELRNLPAEELDRPETRRKIESQAAAEQAQSRRLGALTEAGTALVKEAARNENFGVDHLEKLAEMIQSLKDISENRMPSVSDLLKKASEAETSASSDSKHDKQPPNSVSDNPENPGQQSPSSGDKPKDDDPDKPTPPPSISMRESSMDQPDPNKPKDEKAEDPAGQSSPPKFTLPSVSLADNSPDDGEAAACPAGNKLAEAVDAQEELLAEFQKVAEELQKLINNLEGSTFVKRLKAMSRRELVLANDISQSTLSGFGMDRSLVKEATRDRMKLLVERQKAHSQTMQHIEDDLEAYSNRNQDGKFKTVLVEMRGMEIVKQVNVVADRMVANEPGTSIAHSEFLADTMDRWAEQLGGPG